MDDREEEKEKEDEKEKVRSCVRGVSAIVIVIVIVRGRPRVMEGGDWWKGVGWWRCDDWWKGVGWWRVVRYLRTPPRRPSRTNSSSHMGHSRGQTMRR